MKTIIPLVLAAVLGAACASAPREETRLSVAQDQIAPWPLPSRVVAARMLEKHGAPDDIQPGILAWEHIGYWGRTTVAYDGDGIIEQTLAYPVTSDKRRELHEAFPDKIPYPGVAGELTVRNTSESLNILTMNLADAIVTGGLSAEDARKLYEHAVELEASGKTTPYTQRLQFMPP